MLVVKGAGDGDVVYSILCASRPYAPYRASASIYYIIYIYGGIPVRRYPCTEVCTAQRSVGAQVWHRQVIRSDAACKVAKVWPPWTL